MPDPIHDELARLHRQNGRTTSAASPACGRPKHNSWMLNGIPVRLTPAVG
jgi:hypothetical protein